MMTNNNKKWNYEKHPLERLLSDDRVLLFNFWIADLLVLGFKNETFSLRGFEFTLTVNSILLFIFINYVLFPKFFEMGRVWAFIGLVVISIFVTGYIEEFLIEGYLFIYETTLPIQTPISLLIQYGPPVVVFVLIKVMIFYRNKQIVIDQLSKEKTESQLQFLKSQINPHILFNNLNNIYSLAIQEDKRTPEIVLKLSNLMRYIVYESSENFVLLKKELNYLQDYLELQKIQIEGRGNVIFKIEGNPSGYTIAPLLLIPFVENAFKHSMDTQIDKIGIDISVSINENKLIFQALNSYDKSSKKSISPKGIGLTNTKQRLNLLYPKRHKLEISSDDKIYKVILEIELI